MRRLLCVVLILPLLSGCVGWFFDGESWIDRTRPVVLVETIGGVEFGAATEFGVLTLGRTAKEGPCRVHYFLGPTPMVDDGQIVATGSTFVRAEIDLKTQLARAMDHTPSAEDDLVVMWTPDGTNTQSVAVQLARHEGFEGDVLEHPGQELPPGATVLRTADDGTVQFVGLIAGKATVAGPGSGEYFVYAGVDRIRELIAMPLPHPQDWAPKYRPDDITVMKPVKK
jgi:hypothetical protein